VWTVRKLIQTDESFILARNSTKNHEEKEHFSAQIWDQPVINLKAEFSLKV
jgi:hypothetical protein